MSAVAEMAYDSGLERKWDAVRWVICFVIATAVHGGVALAIAQHVSETSDDFGVDTPLVMLDLPESLVPSMAPPQDLPPGPMEQEESDATPLPREEPKPPEPEADVALPMPEPPKPEPPADEKQATAPAAARTPPRSVVRWTSQLAAHIEHFKRYPAAARARGDSGVATVAFTIDREGRLLHSSLVKSSGSAALDQETLAMLARAQPLPRPPDQLGDDELTFEMPVRFNVR